MTRTAIICLNSKPFFAGARLGTIYRNWYQILEITRRWPLVDHSPHHPIIVSSCHHEHTKVFLNYVRLKTLAQAEKLDLETEQTMSSQ
jgi:hypothetical protein